MRESASDRIEDRLRALAALGIALAETADGLVRAAIAARALGITVHELRARHQPVVEVMNAFRQIDPETALYDPAALVPESPESPTTTHARKSISPRDGASGSTRPSPSTVADAAGQLTRLLRYARHRDCPTGHKSRIYAIKQIFIVWLCDHGFLLSVGKDVGHPGLCRGCNGDGCQRCEPAAPGQSGATKHVYGVFVFGIDGKRYAWDRVSLNSIAVPADIRTFSTRDWRPLREPPILLGRNRFADALGRISSVMRKQ